MKKTAIASALAVGLASTASAQLKGSDTLFDMTQYMLDLCADGVINGVGIPGLTYDGGGSGGGEAAMTAGTQQIAPMSRFLGGTGTSGVCGGTGPGNVNTRQGYTSALDAIGVYSDKTVETNPALDTTCNDMVHNAVMPVQAYDANGNLIAGGTPVCPTINGVSACPGNQYTFASWQHVLRVVYGGRLGTFTGTPNECAFSQPAMNNDEQNCGGDVRRTLVDNWSAMFQGACVDGECGALKHAFRRDDISGTTDTFLSLLSLPGIYASNSNTNPPVASGAGSTQTPNPGISGARPFCNGTEWEDKDPIRRTCDGNGISGGENVCQRAALPAAPLPAAAGGGYLTIEAGGYINVGPNVGGGAAAGHAIQDSDWKAVPAGADNLANNTPGNLGLVLPIAMPVVEDQFPNNVQCAIGSFRLAPMPASPLPAAQQLCPNGLARLLNRCLWPVSATTGNGVFGCVNPQANRPALSQPPLWRNKFDGRVYNLTVRRQDGSIPTMPRKRSTSPTVVNVQVPLFNVGFYRIHQRTVMANATAGATCTEQSDTNQIACLVSASPCSVGYAGVGGLTANANAKVFNLRAPLASAGVQHPTENSNLSVYRLLADDAGGATGTCPNYGARYPFSRKLFLNTLVGFSTVNAAATPEGTLARCWRDRRFTDRAAIEAGFIPVTTDTSCRTASLAGLDPSNTSYVPATAECDLGQLTPSWKIADCSSTPVPGL